MVGLATVTNETVTFEPLFIDILEDNINEQHSRILALMFRLGGYTTLNVLTNLIGIAQPTVSIRVDELVKKGYIRKNTELMPMALVLLLTQDDLDIQLRKRLEVQRNAAKFLQQASDIKNMQLVEDTFIKAIQILYDTEEILAKMIAYIYLHQRIARNKLYQMIDPEDSKFGSIDEQERDRRKKDAIITSRPEIFHIIYKKHQKKAMFIQPRLPLKLFVKHRLVYLESLYTYYRELLLKLGSFMSDEYESIIPHQLLNYPSELKIRIETCLKHYSMIRVIDNAVYRHNNGTNGVVDLIVTRNNFSQNHKVMILSNKSIKLPKTIDTSQFEIRPLKGRISRDYMNRDFIIFGNHGCLVLPSQPRSIPYYNIAPRFTSSVLDIFKANWRNSTAI
ncbi:MAG: MarR family transcriptional regulator [Promethearchaeota archaeon]